MRFGGKELAGGRISRIFGGECGVQWPVGPELPCNSPLENISKKSRVKKN